MGNLLRHLGSLFFLTPIMGFAQFSPSQYLEPEFLPTSQGFERHDVAMDGHGTVMAAFVSAANPDGAFGEDGNVFVSISRDWGATWQDPIRITPNEGYGQTYFPDVEVLHEYNPAIEHNEAGNWMVVWHEVNSRSLFAASSKDNGANWETPSLIAGDSPETKVDSFAEESELVSLGEDVWIVPAFTTLDHQIHSFRSVDGGANWSHSVITPDRVGIRVDATYAAAKESSGEVLVVWQEDLPSPHRFHIASSRSQGNGNTWSEPVSIITVPGSTYHAGHAGLHMASDGHGTLVMTWGDYGSGALGAMSVSNDDGMTWSEPVLLTDNKVFGEYIEGYSLFSDVATSGMGRFMIVTMFEGKIGALDQFAYKTVFSLTEDGGKSWSAARHVDPAQVLEQVNHVSPHVAGALGDRWVVSWSLGFGPGNHIRVARSAGNLQSDPSPLDLGQTFVNSAPVSRTVLVANSPDALRPVAIAQVRLQGVSSNAFDLATSPTLPGTLQPNEELEIVARFQPEVYGIQTSEIIIESDDATSPVLRTSLSGFGKSQGSAWVLLSEQTP